MERKTAITTVRTVWQVLAGLGQEAAQEASRAKECLDQLEDVRCALNGHQIKAIVDEVADLMRTVNENDSAQRTPQQTESTKPTTRDKKYDIH